MIINNENGLTIKQLKEYVANLPEKDEHGDDYTVWVGTFGNASNLVKSVWPLNGIPGDIILQIC